MPIHAPHNLYRGVNPHLMSLLQTSGDELSLYESFHNALIGYLRMQLNQHLPEGYSALSEQSLQILTDAPKPKRPRPDVTVFRKRDMPIVQARGLPPAAEPTLIIDIEDLLADLPEYLTAVTVYQIKPVRSKLPVLRFELLSPANKEGGTHHRFYLAKRGETLRSAIPLVEIDLLHEQPPILSKQPIYPHEEKSAPYSIGLTLPPEKIARIYDVFVNESLPTINLPLVGSDQVLVNFDQVYQDTYNENSFYHDEVDYAQLPARFDTYSADDQARIRARIAEIAAEYPEEQN